MNPRINKKKSCAFTLIELLIVIAVIAILAALVIRVSSQLSRSAESTHESGALRQLLTAYTSAATDNKGKLISGYSNGEGEKVFDPNGETVHWPASGRYVWRLLPFLDNSLDTLYPNRQQEVLSQVSETDCYTYVMSLFPSFGLNSEWLGGDYRTTASPTLASKRLYASFLSDIKQPARQLVFTSAAAPSGIESDAGISDCLGSHPEELVKGYFEIKSPYDFDWRWNTLQNEQTFVPTGDSADYGYVDPRHEGDVLTGQLDGSTTFVTLKDLSDMRRWAHLATHPEWNLSDIFP